MAMTVDQQARFDALKLVIASQDAVGAALFVGGNPDSQAKELIAAAETIRKYIQDGSTD